MQKAEVVETVETEEISEPQKTRYTATIILTNSQKVAFGRRDLALCFYPPKVVSKADRNYEVITIDGTVVPFQNARLVHRIWDIVQKKYIYDKTVQKRPRHSFDWHKISKRLCRDYKLVSFRAFPERGGNKFVTELKITTDTSEYIEHVEVIETLYQKIREKAPHLTLEKSCYYNVMGPCATELEAIAL